VNKNGLFSMLLISVFITAIQLALTGFVLSQLWAWFIVPVFHVSELTVAQAIGVALVAGFVTHKPDLSEGDEARKFTKLATDAVLHPVLFLIIAFVVRLLAGSS